MSNITKEQIQRLEKIGLAVADCIEDEYTEVKKSTDNRRELIYEIYNNLSGIIDRIDEEEPDDEE